MWAGAVPGWQEMLAGGAEGHESSEVYSAAEHISIYSYKLLAGGGV